MLDLRPPSSANLSLPITCSQPGEQFEELRVRWNDPVDGCHAARKIPGDSVQKIGSEILERGTRASGYARLGHASTRHAYGGDVRT